MYEWKPIGRGTVYTRRPFGRFPLGFMPILVVPRFGRVQEGRSDPDRQEKELLRALERHEEITAARVAMETSLSIAQAEEMLTKLASGGHVEVRARAGTLTYALHEADRSVAGPKELAQVRTGHEPIE